MVWHGQPGCLKALPGVPSDARSYEQDLPLPARIVVQVDPSTTAARAVPCSFLHWHHLLGLE